MCEKKPKNAWNYFGKKKRFEWWQKRISVNIIWNEWIFEEIVRCKMLGEGLWKQWRISIRMDEKFQKNQFIQNHSKANSAVAILSWTNSAIILLLYFFPFEIVWINEVLISFLFFEKKMHASVPIMMLLLYLKFRDTLGNN